MKKLSLNKDIISNITNGEMSKLKGGQDEEQVELCGSKVVCTTYFNTGNCKKSKSCESIICIPI